MAFDAIAWCTINNERQRKARDSGYEKRRKNEPRQKQSRK